MRIVRVVRNVSVLLLAAGAALGCGGGGGAAVVPDPIPPPPSGNVTLDVIADGPLSGEILDSVAGRTLDVPVVAGQSKFGASETEVRGVATFVWSVPAGATLVSATLRCTPTDVKGNPTGVVDALMLDHFDVGATLDTSDFDGGPLFQASCATLAPSGSPLVIGTEVSTVVTAQVQADRTAARGRSCFRLLFPAAVINIQGINQVQFGTGGTASAPVLTIVYTP